MKRIVVVLGVLIVALFALAAVPARPGSELSLFTLLNGQSMRWIMPDGGVSGMYGTGQQCIPLSNVPGTVVKLVSNLPTGFCVRPSPDGYAWDGGCNAPFVGDMNFAEPWQAGVAYYVTLSPGTSANPPTHVCQVGDAGSTVTAAWVQK